MLLILKIPIVYLCVVIWYAIQPPPLPPSPAEVVAVFDPPPAGRSPSRRGRVGARVAGRPQAQRRRRAAPHSTGIRA